MITLTPNEVIAVKADASRRFGSDRCLQVLLSAPIDAAVVVSPFDYKAVAAHVDARAQNVITAQSNAVTDRVLWCSPTLPDAASAPADVSMLTASKDDPEPLRRVALERLETLRETWPIVNAEVERELRRVSGWVLEGVLHAVPLTPGTAPRGIAAKRVLEMLADAPAKGPGSLWSVQGGSGAALVLKAPLVDVWHGARAAWSEARQQKSGILESFMVLVRQLIVWSPEPLDAYIDRVPGFAEGLWNPLLEMGGAATQASSSFL
jgi:hypothetical protein